MGWTRTGLAGWLMALVPCLMAADWTGFRGPGGAGVSDEKNVPLKWDDQTNIAWKIQLPGRGSSSPVTFGDKIFVTCYSGYAVDQANPGEQKDLRLHLVCLSRKDGSVLWDKAVEAKTPVEAYDGFARQHGYASSTPAVDADAVYTFFGRTGVTAWSHAGNSLWTQDVGSGTHGWGTGTSPVLAGDLVIVNASVESGALVALNRKTGEIVWRQLGMNQSWNTPSLVAVDGRQELVVSVHGSLKAYDPAAKGNPLWSCAGISDYVCPSVVSSGGVVFAIGGRKNTAVAVRAGGQGDVTQSHGVWRIEKGANVPSPVYVNDHLYWPHDRSGALYCVNAKTGVVVYEKVLEPRPDQFYASPTVADGRIYLVSRQKGTYVVAAKPEFELLAHNVIASDRNFFNASPAVSNGQILLRSDLFLYCIGQK